MMRAFAVLLLAAGCELFLDSSRREDTAENCSNGIDDDGDGKIDCADPDCRGLAVCQPGGQSCGNGVVDPGETCDIAIALGTSGACPVSCDDANTCTTDQLTGGGTCFAACWHAPLPSCCGNGTVETGESCDDGNQADYDGCSSACEFERVLVTQSIRWLPGPEGCDLDGDGAIDNAFGTSASQITLNRLSDYYSHRSATCRDSVVLWLLTGADPTMQRAALRFSFMAAVAMPPNPADYFTGSDPFFVLPGSLDELGHPRGAVNGSATMGAVQTETGRLSYWLPCLGRPGALIPFDLRPASLTGAIMADATRPLHGTLRMCAAVTAASLHRATNATGVGGPTILDLVVVGVNALGYSIAPTQPDIDADGDGLETFRDTDGDGLVDQCRDGNGAIVTGTDCPSDPRFADGYSMTVELEAVGALLSGRAP